MNDLFLEVHSPTAARCGTFVARTLCSTIDECTDELPRVGKVVIVAIDYHTWKEVRSSAKGKRNTSYTYTDIILSVKFSLMLSQLRVSMCSY